MPPEIINNPQPSPTQRTAEARAAFTASLNSVGSNLDAELRSRAVDLHSNAAALSKQEDDLRRATANLGKQNEQWQKIADQAREGLKEIGDVQNWAELLERDLLIVEETLRLVEEEDDGKKKGKGKGKARVVGDGEERTEEQSENERDGNGDVVINDHDHENAKAQEPEPVKQGGWRWW